MTALMRYRFNKRVGPFALSVFLVVTFLSLSTAFAEQDIQDKIEKKRQQLVDVEIKKRGLLGTLYGITKEIKKNEQDLQSLRHQQKSTQKNIDEYVVVIKRLQDTLTKQKIKLHERLRAMSKFGYLGYSQLLFSSKSSVELGRNIKFLKIIAQKDQVLIENYAKGLDDLAVQRDKLREQVKSYAMFDRQLTDQQKKLIDHRSRQMFVIRKIENERESHLQALKELREASERLDSKMGGYNSTSISAAANESFFERRGLLNAPVEAEILQHYGMIHNSRFKTDLFHKGLFFGAHEGQDVLSVFDGVVAYSGWLDGYGETVIVDHGDHYYSLYSHNRKIIKTQGERARAGEKISEVGDTGSLRGPGLYFELRHFSETLDPESWLNLPRAKVGKRALF